MFDFYFEVFERAGNRAQIGIAVLVRILVEEIGNAPQIGARLLSGAFRKRIVLARVYDRMSRGQRIDWS